MAIWDEFSFQDGASPLMEQLIFFHDHTMVILIFITMLIGYMMFSLMYSKYLNRLLLEGQEIETMWTVFPAFILIFIALPSLRLLYLLDEINNPFITLKVIGHQWYWSYEYSDFKDLEFDSYMIQINDMMIGDFRLLDVDNRVVLPSKNQIRILVSAADVLHSWAIPALGLKVDAVPGRLNQVMMYISHIGLFIGQCSEICGANHSFMPIVLESIPVYKFLEWLKIK
uniref:Cytochrome c oxidase subunit 2 n=1 Tax=Opisthopatus cinctipes TaxID=574546 RepID=D7QYT6_9BILA|nr:cytochrome c oxidase subunit II [Opisthopatus cinctipes]ADE05866.1 cytochrome c oxidase subunit II [Opisthopatus cinctipes]